MCKMVTNHINKLAEDLEKQELEAASGVVSAQVYAQLLAIYLYQNDLCNAKYLWKRIPQSLKTTNAELAQIWSVGQNMWLRDFPAIYKSLTSVTWSEPVAEIMKAVQDNVRTRAADLISHAYSSISLDTVAEMTGFTSDLAVKASLDKGWSVEKENRIVQPTPPKLPSTGNTSSEDQLYKLTEFVSFLEN